MASPTGRKYDSGVGKKFVDPFFDSGPSEDLIDTLQKVLPGLEEQLSFFVTSPGPPVKILYVSKELRSRISLAEHGQQSLLEASELFSLQPDLWNSIEESIRYGREIRSPRFSFQTSKDGLQAHTCLHMIPVQSDIGRLVLYIAALPDLTIHPPPPGHDDNDTAPSHPSSSSAAAADVDAAAAAAASAAGGAETDADSAADALEAALSWRTTLTRAKVRRLSRIPFPEAFVLSDPWRPDNPLVWCSHRFYAMTGYAAAEILGRNCRFLQGHDTDQEEIDKLREGITQFQPVTACFRNYRKDGTAFWNHISMYPVLDDEGGCLFFSAMQYDASWLMDIALSEGEEGLLGEETTAENLSRIDDIQAEINIRIRDIALGQADDSDKAGEWQLKTSAITVEPLEWEQQVKTRVVVAQASNSLRTTFSAEAAPLRQSCPVWE